MAQAADAGGFRSMHTPFQTRRTKTLPLAFALGLGCWMVVAASAQEQEAAPTAENLKLAYLLKFPGFVTWPKQAFPNAKAPLIIAVWSGEKAAPEGWSKIVEKERYGARPVKFREVKSWDETKGCHVLLLLAVQPPPPPPDAVRRQSLLIVGETGAGMPEAAITFAREGDRLRFDINVPLAKSAGLVMDARLLKLARRVKLENGKEDVR